MKWLADENFPMPVIALLRAAGHDVFAVAESMAGAPDAQILTAAVREDRILITLDRDYGDLVFHYRRPVPPGVILFRLSGRPAEDNRRIIETLEGPDRWTGRFSTVTDLLIRSRTFSA